MTEEMKQAILALAKQASQSKVAHEAMQLSQAALNLAHACATMVGIGHH